MKSKNDAFVIQISKIILNSVDKKFQNFYKRLLRNNFEKTQCFLISFLIIV